MSRADIIRDLRERLRQLERSERGAKGPVLEAACQPEACQPEMHPPEAQVKEESRWFFSRALEWGTLIEWLGAEGSGAATLALLLAAEVLRQEGALVVVDRRGEFYPPAAAALGVELQRCVIVRPGSDADALWTLEQSLRSGGAAVVLGWLGSLPGPTLRRLQLAAEAGGSLGFLLRPVACRAEPSWAQLRLLVEPVRSGRGTPSALDRRLRVEVLHCRGGAAGEVVEMELSDETGPVHLAARLGRPT